MVIVMVMVTPVYRGFRGQQWGPEFWKLVLFVWLLTFFLVSPAINGMILTCAWEGRGEGGRGREGGREAVVVDIGSREEEGRGGGGRGRGGGGEAVVVDVRSRRKAK